MNRNNSLTTRKPGCIVELYYECVAEAMFSKYQFEKPRHEESLASGATNLSLGVQGHGFEPRRGSLHLVKD